VAITKNVEVVKTDAKAYLLQSTIKSEAKLKILIETYSNIEIIDKATFEAAKKGSNEMKKIRGAIDSNRLDITRPFNDFKSDMIAFVKPWTEQLSAAELKINADLKTFEDKAKAEAEKKMAERQQLFAESGFKVVAGNYVCGPLVLTPEQIEKFTEDEVKVYVDLGNKETKRINDEAERIAKEKADFAQQKADFAKREADLVAREQALAKDKEIVNGLIDKTKPEPEAKPIEVKKPIETPSAETTEAAAKIDEQFPPVQIEEKPKVDPEKVKLMKRLGQAGFDNLRNQLIELVEDRSIKLSRDTLIDWAKNAKLKPNK
jgi:hypothetical protein